MKADKLVRMANQIAANFDYGGDREKTVAGIADHLSRFWTPEMRVGIIEHARSGDTGLTELAEQAVATLAQKQSSAA